MKFAHAQSGKVKDRLKLHNSRADARHCFTSPGDSGSALAPAVAAALQSGHAKPAAAAQPQPGLPLAGDARSERLSQS